MGTTIRWFSLVVVLCGCLAVPVGAADCPSADLTGDCRVDVADLAVLAGQWMLNGLAPQDMVFIPGGTFEMGDSFGEGHRVELPVHTVTVSPFYMSAYEITNGEYCSFLNSALDLGLITVANGIVSMAGRENEFPYLVLHTVDTASQIAYSDGSFYVCTKAGRNMCNDPVTYVNWYGAAAYCNWQSEREGREKCYAVVAASSWPTVKHKWQCDLTKNGYHLPTEAQWEYAARGGLAGCRFPWGDTISHAEANYRSSDDYDYDTSPTRGYHPAWSDIAGPFSYTSPVGSFAANGYGLYDMTGNVWEWCNGLAYSYERGESATSDPVSDSRVLRGGTWYHSVYYCRVASRFMMFAAEHESYYGFRISR